jgi:hypothetical protein
MFYYILLFNLSQEKSQFTCPLPLFSLPFYSADNYNMTDTKYSTLYVIGDSFSVPPKYEDSTQTWPALVAAGLSEQLGHPVRLENHSRMGVSQDYCWEFLQALLEAKMTPDDYLIVALTHPSRFWFLDQTPELSNSNIVDLDEHCSKDEAKAIEYYIRYIQRPRLDLIFMNNRMGYLSYQTLKKKLRRPVVIKCFGQDVDQAENWSELNWAKGILMDDVQRWEFEDVDADLDAKFWHGLDGRYNHLCLSNHKILANKLVNSLITDTACDLTEGFVKGLIKNNAMQDDEFVLNELDTSTVVHNLEHREKYMPIMPWAKRRKIYTGQVDK